MHVNILVVFLDVDMLQMKQNQARPNIEVTGKYVTISINKYPQSLIFVDTGCGL